MKVLVVADGRHGATVEIANTIAETLRHHDIEVDLRRPEPVTSVLGYDAVVAGSAVYVGRWVDSMRSFVRRMEGELLGLPVWLFSSGPLEDPADDDLSAESAQITSRLGARGHAVFAGRLDPRELNWCERVGVKVVKAPTGDFRDWEQIKEWAATIAMDLWAGSTVSGG